MKLDGIIRKVARRYGVSPDEVRREMQVALDATWAGQGGSERDRLFPNGKPSLEEFVTTLARNV